MANPSPLNQAITSIVQQDPQLAEEARQLAHKAIEIANHYLDNGSSRVQLEVVRSIMPAIGRGMTEKQDENQELNELREQLASLMQLVMGDPVAS